MATVNYALKVTLVDNFGSPIMRCWGPVFEVIDGVPSDPGWHHFVVSFDSSVPRIQMAMDRGGGPVLGGGVMDTGSGFGEVADDGSFPDVDSFTHGEMYAVLLESSLDGFNPQAGLLSNVSTNPQRDWLIFPSTTEVTDYAYCYFGTGIGDAFYDLKGSTDGIPNLNRFISPSLTAVNFGNAGRNIPLNCAFMHTGYFSWTGAQLGGPFAYNAADGVLWGGTADPPGDNAATEPPTGA